jgi:hypothetical protein
MNSSETFINYSKYICGYVRKSINISEYQPLIVTPNMKLSSQIIYPHEWQIIKYNFIWKHWNKEINYPIYKRDYIYLKWMNSYPSDPNYPIFSENEFLQEQSELLEMISHQVDQYNYYYGPDLTKLKIFYQESATQSCSEDAINNVEQFMYELTIPIKDISHYLLMRAVNSIIKKRFEIKKLYEIGDMQGLEFFLLFNNLTLNLNQEIVLLDEDPIVDILLNDMDIEWKVMPVSDNAEKNLKEVSKLIDLSVFDHIYLYAPPIQRKMEMVYSSHLTASTEKHIQNFITNFKTTVNDVVARNHGYEYNDSPLWQEFLYGQLNRNREIGYQYLKRIVQLRPLINLNPLHIKNISCYQLFREGLFDPSNPINNIYFDHKEFNAPQKAFVFNYMHAVTSEIPYQILMFTGTGKTSVITNCTASAIYLRYISNPPIYKTYPIHNRSEETEGKIYPLKNERIIYTTHTVQQMSQIIKSIKKDRTFTWVSSLKVHKHWLCINDDYKENLNIYDNFDSWCYRKTVGWSSKDFIDKWNRDHSTESMKKVYVKMCPYWKNLGKDRKPPERGKEHKDPDCRLMSIRSYDNKLAVYDIEDIKDYGRKKCKCPYFLNKSAIPPSNLIIQTYKFLNISIIKPITTHIDYQGILVADEAHNLPNEMIELTRCVLSASNLMNIEKECMISEISIPNYFNTLKAFYIYLCSILRKSNEWGSNKVKKADQQSTLDGFLNLNPQTTVNKIVNLGEEKNYPKNGQSHYIPLNSAVEGFGFKIEGFILLIQNCKEKFIELWRERRIISKHLTNLVTLATYLEQLDIQKERVSSFYIYTDSNDICCQYLKMGGKKYEGLRNVYFKCVDSMLIFTTTMKFFNNHQCFSGSYNDGKIAAIQLDPNNGYRSSTNRLSFFQIVDEHVINKRENIMVVPICYDLNDSSKRRSNSQ